jgi:GTP-binding protein Era
MSQFKSGYVGIVGKPNVGKSTLLNRLLGEKIAITSHKPQTTRTRIMGVLTSKESQIIFIDTPGIHQPQDQLHHYMMNEINETMKEVDLILFLVEPSIKPSIEDLLSADYLKKTQQPAILVLNKIDRYQNQAAACIEKYNDIAAFKESVCISALQGTGCDELISSIEKYLPVGPQFYPEDTLTDKSERFLIAELIREKVYEMLHQEIPYSVAVVTEEVKEKTDKLTYIKAVIYVEKESQKGIIIGNQGQMLKSLGQEARKEIEILLQKQVYLDLWVKVKKNWRKNPTALKALGLEEE